MVTMQMALRICGTKQRGAGFVPLVNIGLLPKEIGENMDISFTFTDSPAYVLRHSRDYIAYQLVDRKVKSYDADASGVLSIALTISKDARLSDGKSPYSLLMETYFAFREHFMTPQSDGRYSFINRDMDDSVFQDIVRRYSLEERPGVYIPMEGQDIAGVLQVPEELMEVFFLDTQYKEFRKYSEIQIGAHCKSFEAFRELAIPRIPEYEVVLTDYHTHKDSSTVSIFKNATDSYHASKMGNDKWEYSPLDFTLGELCAASGHLEKDAGTVILYEKEAKIRCTLKPHEAMYTLKVDKGGDVGAVEEAVEKDNLKLFFGLEDITGLLIHPVQMSISASQLDDLPKVEPKENKTHTFYPYKKIESGSRELLITVRATRRPTYPSYGDEYTRRSEQWPVHHEEYNRHDGHHENYGKPVPRHEPDPLPTPNPDPIQKGFDFKSFLMGVAAGLGIGVVGMIVFEEFSLRLEWVGRDEKVIKITEHDGIIKDKHRLDSLNKDLNKIIEELKQQLEEQPVSSNNSDRRSSASRSSSSSTSYTKPVDEAKNAILAAFQNGKSYDDIKKMPEFSKIKGKAEDLALQWVLLADDYTTNVNGRFKGDPRYLFDPNHCNSIRMKADTFLSRRSNCTWDAIISTRQEIISILNGN